MRVIALNHAEQVVRGVLLVRQDEYSNALGMRGPPVVSAANVGRDALLPSLEHKGSNSARSLLLRFEPTMQIDLSLVEFQRSYFTGLRSDLETLGRVMPEVALEPLPDRPFPIIQARQELPRGS